MEQSSSSTEHVNRCCIVSSPPHSQITLVDGSVKPHFYSSVITGVARLSTIAVALLYWHEPGNLLEFPARWR